MMQFITPTLQKAIFTLISSLILSQLIPAIGLQEVPATQPLLSGQVYISNPGDDSVNYRLSPLYWLPSYLLFRFSGKILTLNQAFPYSLVYWILVSYLTACVVFEVPPMIKSRLEALAIKARSDHFSG